MGHRNLRVSAALALSVSCVLGACSIGAEDSPRTWSDWVEFEQLPENSPTGVEHIYLLSSRFDDNPKLTAVNRDPDGDGDVYRGILEVLFRGPTSDEARQGLKSSIPNGVSLFESPRRESGTIVVNLTEELTNAIGNDLVKALAQIVWTISDLAQESQVRILVENRAYPLPRADDTLVDRPLTTFDYSGFVETSQPDFPGIIEPNT